MGYQWALSEATHAITGGRMGPPSDKLMWHYSDGAGHGVLTTELYPVRIQPDFLHSSAQGPHSSSFPSAPSLARPASLKIRIRAFIALRQFLRAVCLAM